MRIVAGQWRGRALKAPTSPEIRPTSDRARETIFNVLAHRFDHACRDARVIDLFAGTGALGLEALSRGAAYALFVDEGIEARALLRDNIEALSAQGITRIFRRSATDLGAALPPAPYTLAFLDPPYQKGLLAPALASLQAGQWLAKDALLVAEFEAGGAFALPSGFIEEHRTRIGAAEVVFLRFEG